MNPALISVTPLHLCFAKTRGPINKNLAVGNDTYSNTGRIVRLGQASITSESTLFPLLTSLPKSHWPPYSRCSGNISSLLASNFEGVLGRIHGQSRFTSSRGVGRNHVQPTHLHCFKNWRIHQRDRDTLLSSSRRFIL